MMYIGAAAAAAAGLLGTLAAVIIPRRQRGWADQAREIADDLINYRKEKSFNRNHVIGGLAGSLVGITTALLFAPKSGNELLKDLTRSIPAIPGIQRTSIRVSAKSTKRRRPHAVLRHQAAAKQIQKRSSRRSKSKFRKE